MRSGWEKGPAGGLPLTGEGLDALVELYAAEGVVGGYTLKEGLPVISLKVERRKGGVQLSCTPRRSAECRGWTMPICWAKAPSGGCSGRNAAGFCRYWTPLAGAVCSLPADAAAFCSYVLPELGNRVNIVNPDRLLLNQIPLEPVVQFYLDADRGLTVTAYPVFLYGEDRVAPGEPVPPDLLRDARTDNAAAGNLSGTRARQAGTLQPFRGGGAFPAAGGGHSRPAGHGRGIPDRCLPDASRPA